MRREDQQSKVLYELSDLVLNILRCPPSTLQFSDHSPAMPSPLSRRPSGAVMPQITPMELMLLLFGISMALMLCGSVTFFLGFFLMPWVIGLVIVLYFVGIISSLTMLARAILSHAKSPCKDIPGE